MSRQPTLERGLSLPFLALLAVRRRAPRAAGALIIPAWVPAVGLLMSAATVVFQSARFLGL